MLLRAAVVLCAGLAVAPHAWAQQADEEAKLKELLDLLNTKITTAERREQRVADIPASVVVITREEIERQGYQSLEDVLLQIPGLYGIDSYYWVGTLNLGTRGFFSVGSFSDMVVLVNGVQQKEDWYDSNPFSKLNVPVEAIDRVEVVRGPMSVVYGSGAFFGAINIITNDVRKTEQTIAASAGSSAMQRYFVRSSLKGPDYSLVLNTAVMSKDGGDFPYSSIMSSQKRTEFGVAGQARTKGQLDEAARYFGASGSFAGFEMDLAGTSMVKGVVDAAPSLGKGHEIHVSSFIGSLAYKLPIGDHGGVTARYGYSLYRNYYDYKYLAPNPITGAPDPYGTGFIFTDAQWLSLDGHWSLDTLLEVTGGLHYRQVMKAWNGFDILIGIPQLENTDIRVPRGDRVDHVAAWAQGTVNPLPWLKLVAGGRIEEMGEYDIETVTYRTDHSGTEPVDQLILRRHFDATREFVPRFALILSPSPQHVVKALYGKASKHAPIGNSSDQVVFPDQATLARPEIETLELNYLFSLDYRLSANFSVFYNRMQRLINRINTFEGIISNSAGDQEALGAELTVATEPLPGLKLEVSGTYQFPKDKRRGYEKVDLAFAPQILGYVKASYTFRGMLTGAFTGRYVGSMLSELGVASPIARIGPKTKEYILADFNLRLHDWPIEGLFAHAHVSNIGDQEIRYPTTGSSSWADLGTLGGRRDFVFGAGYRF